MGGFKGNGFGYNRVTTDKVYDGNVYKDMYGQISAARVPASNAPTWTNFTIGSFTTQVLSFGVGDYIDIFVQTNHDMRLAQTFDNHIHWSVMSADAEAGDTFKFQVSGIGNGITYSWSGVTAVSQEVTIGTEHYDRHNYLDLGSIDVPNPTVSSVYVLRLERIASSGTEASKVFVFFNDSHLKIDQIGSLTETSKTL